MSELTDKILADARSDLDESETILLAIEKIVDYVYQSGPDQSSRLTLSNFYSVISDFDKECIKLALAYLCNSDSSIFDVHFEYFPEENSPVPIEAGEARKAILRGTFVDPISGEESEEYLANLMVVYSAKAEVFDE